MLGRSKTTTFSSPTSSAPLLRHQVDHRVVVDQRVVAGADLHLGPGAQGRGDALGGLTHPAQHQLADARLEAPDGAHQLHPAGDDVGLGAAVDRAEADHRAVAGVDVAADHRLHRRDHLRRGDDRVDAAGRIGAVGGATVHDDPQIVRGGVALAVAQAEGADLEIGVHVQAEDGRYRRLLEDALLDQQLGSADGLLGRLEDQLDRPWQLGPPGGQQPRGAEKDRRCARRDRRRASCPAPVSGRGPACRPRAAGRRGRPAGPPPAGRRGRGSGRRRRSSPGRRGTRSSARRAARRPVRWYGAPRDPAPDGDADPAGSPPSRAGSPGPHPAGRRRCGPAAGRHRGTGWGPRRERSTHSRAAHEGPREVAAGGHLDGGANSR